MSSYGGWSGQPGPTGPPPGWNYVPQAPKPGVIPLQPLRVGDIFNGIFGAIRHYFWALYGPLLIVLAGLTVLWTVTAALCYQPLHTLYDNVQSANTVTGSQGAELFGFVALATVLLVLSAVVGYITAGLTSAAVLRHAVIGRPATMRQVVGETLPRVWSALGVAALLALALILDAGIAVLLLILPGGLVALGVLFLIASYIVMIFVGVRLLLVLPAVMLENQGPVTSLRRAWRLNQGNWWRTLGISILTSMVAGIASEIVNLPVSLFTSNSSFSTFTVTPGQSLNWSDLPSFGGVWLSVVGAMATVIISQVITAPMAGLTNGLLYIDQRIRRESLDVQLAEEAGVPLAQQPPQPQYQAAYQPPYPPQPPYGGWQQPGAGWQPQPGQSPYGSWPGQQPPPPPYGGWQPMPPPPASHVPPVPPVPPVPSDEGPSLEKDKPEDTPPA